jgi:hypothetical protein
MERIRPNTAIFFILWLRIEVFLGPCGPEMRECLTADLLSWNGIYLQDVEYAI